MEKKKKSNGFKEWLRKFTVSLKRRPHNIPLVFMLITYLFYSLNLTKISNTTAVININPMGLCEFVIMLLSILAMVSFLNAFPVRKKAKLPMVIILYVIIACCILADVVYLMKINVGLESADLVKNAFILTTYNIVLVHLILEVISALLIALIPVISILLNKIDTSIDLEEDSGIKKIDVEDE